MKKIIKKIKDKLFIAKQKNLLLTEKSYLEKELKIDNKFPQYGDSEEANASEVTEFTQRQGIEKQLINKSEDVNKALENIEKNKYGICEKCKHIIEKSRLEVIPSARTCSVCSDKRH